MARVATSRSAREAGAGRLNGVRILSLSTGRRRPGARCAAPPSSFAIRGARHGFRVVQPLPMAFAAPAGPSLGGRLKFLSADAGRAGTPLLRRHDVILRDIDRHPQADDVAC